MSVIEGIGDEVTLFFTILLICLIICFAWISTNIRDIPFFSIFIIELTQGRRRANQERQSQENTEQSSDVHQSSNQDTTSVNSSSSNEQQDLSGLERHESVSVQTDQKQTEVTKLESSEAGAPYTSDKRTENCEDSVEVKHGNVSCDTDISSQHDESQQGSVIKTNISESELRQRRVNFFSRKKDEGHDDSGVTLSSCSDNSKDDSQTLKSVCTGSLSDENVSPKTSNAVSEEEDDDDDDDDDDDEKTDGSEESIRGTTTNTIQQEDTSSHQRPEVELQREQVTIRLKYLNDTQRNVTASLEDTIGQFRRANFAAELSENKLVRFIFNGQDLRNDANTLQAYNVANNSVIHCLITQANLHNPTPQNNEDHGGFDISMLMLPVFGLIICFVWYLRFEHRQLFTATSTISLIGVTFLFVAAVLASWEGFRRDQHAHHEHIE